MIRVSYSPGYYAPLPAKHIFPMGKFEGLYRYLTEKNIVTQSCIVEPGLVSIDHLMYVHTSRYIDGILNGVLTKKEIRKLGLP